MDDSDLMANANIPLSAGAGPSQPQLIMPLQAQNQVLSLQQLQQKNMLQAGELALQAQNVQDTQTLSQLYHQNTNPDGTIDANGIIKGLGDAGSGHLIPAFQTQQQALAKSAADTASTQATTQNTQYDLLTKKLTASSASIGSLLDNPNVTHDDVVHSLATQVKNGLLDLPHAQNTVSDMPTPTGDPAQDTANLHQWLVQQNLKIEDAKSRVADTIPKLALVNTGQATVFPDTNPITNGGAVAPLPMSATPGEQLSAAVQQRGQNMQFQTDNTSLQQTPGGFTTVNKAANTSTPVLNPNGTQVLPAASAVFKNEQSFADMQQTAQMARDILTGSPSPTHSTFGTGLDATGRFVGIATAAADNAAKLDALSGRLTSFIPRMEGSQSDADVKLYAQQAGNVGDSSLPLSVRLSALDAVMQLQKKYASLNGGLGQTPLGTQPVVAPSAIAPPPGAVAPVDNRPPLSAFHN